jgi:hypothetical protein
MGTFSAKSRRCFSLNSGRRWIKPTLRGPTRQTTGVDADAYAERTAGPVDRVDDLEPGGQGAIRNTSL